MFEYIKTITPLNKREKHMTNKHCRKCGKSLPIMGRGVYCLKCIIPAKKERLARYRANKIAKALK